ncbi:pyruvate kinase [Thermoactinomyces vulgaris]|jgi:pyruvate kinase|uniref:Pyruvate kinase n=1 Tax=Laceyella sediminis TaxID=573074 RepID=A0ABX5EUL4_9BACL|nr:pyruvate kinase [Laceyella sediminis]KPC73799.1 pyruvate kinase [Thermoactinomyces vulgaris]PRZ16055.1 pyruvate kinase [Laceyella sediminis]
MLRKTKIVCTIGPASEDVATLKELIANGMNVARLNFSHGSYEEHGKRIENIRQAAAELGQTVAILLDTKGPEIRTGELKDPSVELIAGEQIILTTEQIEGDAKRISISYAGLAADVHPGSIILIDDGLIGLRVESVEGTEITCTILNGGTLKSRKGVNVPGVKINLPGITEKDAADIRFGIEQKVDFIAASFVRKPQDVLEIREILEEHGADIQIISKIENQEGIDNLDGILEVSDGLMVARGDLGVEIPVEEVPVVQKEAIRKCNQLGKPVITATQMLDSMQRNPRPTRAEASDVANAILDGTDAIMLSGETAAGKYPVEAVSTMARIAVRTEATLRYEENFKQKMREIDYTITESLSQAVVHTAQMLNCAAVLTPTESGFTARMVSKYRPQAPIVAITRNPDVARKLALVWGVYPLLGTRANTTDEMFHSTIATALEHGFVNQGDLVVITAGVPVGKSGTTNLMKVHVIGGFLARGQGIGKQVVTGPVVTGRTAAEINENMVDGGIIVVKASDKEMIESFKRAAAVITEEGGLTSHAAVVGVSLGVPVVVGVENACKLLANEKEITVNVDRGHIYAGKANVL